MADVERRDSGAVQAKAARTADRIQDPGQQAAGLQGSRQDQAPRRSPITKKVVRLVYEVQDHELLVLVVAVGKRERNAVYRQADKR